MLRETLTATIEKAAITEGYAFHTGFAYLLYFSAMAELPSQTIALLGYIDPVSALIFSAALLGERLSPVQLLGAALVLGGAAFGELWQKKKSA